MNDWNRLKTEELPSERLVVSAEEASFKILEPQLETVEFAGGEINSTSVDRLFRLYRKFGFLYPDKAKALSPYIEQVKKNWKHALALGETIFWIASIESEDSRDWASLCCWRSSYSSWVCQHLVSSGNPVYSRGLLLGAQTKFINECNTMPSQTLQNWYRPNNKYAKKVFGSLQNTVGPEASSIDELGYSLVDPRTLTNPHSDIEVCRCTSTNIDDFKAFIKSERSHVYIQGLDLDLDDIEMTRLDAIYQKAGLSRKRYVYIAKQRFKPSILGACIVHRAPIGLNFSFLENQCELILKTEMAIKLKTQVIQSLLGIAREHYSDFETPYIPTMVSLRDIDAFSQIGQCISREYNHSMWTEPGFYGWYKNVDTLFKKVLKKTKA